MPDALARALVMKIRLCLVAYFKLYLEIRQSDMRQTRKLDIEKVHRNIVILGYRVVGIIQTIQCARHECGDEEDG